MLQTAPVLLLFPPTSGPNAVSDTQSIRFDFNGYEQLKLCSQHDLIHTHSPQSAEHVYAWIQRHMGDGPRPPLVRPVNYGGIVVGITAILGLVTFGTVAWPYILPVIQNRNLWAGVSLIAILLFTSGHMFNHIRKVPYVAGDGKGGISYFAGGFQNQFGLETQIVAAMCE